MFLAQAVAVGGIFLFSLIGSWVFGREFVDGTVTDLLAVPVARWTILLAKFIVVMVWSVTVDGDHLRCRSDSGRYWSGCHKVRRACLCRAAPSLAVTTGLVVAVMTPVAFFASAGRGYLATYGCDHPASSCWPTCSLWPAGEAISPGPYLHYTPAPGVAQTPALNRQAIGSCVDGSGGDGGDSPDGGASQTRAGNPTTESVEHPTIVSSTLRQYRKDCMARHLGVVAVSQMALVSHCRETYDRAENHNGLGQIRPAADSWLAWHHLAVCMVTLRDG